MFEEGFLMLWVEEGLEVVVLFWLFIDVIGIVLEVEIGWNMVVLFWLLVNVLDVGWNVFGIWIVFKIRVLVV